MEQRNDLNEEYRIEDDGAECSCREAACLQLLEQAADGRIRLSDVSDEVYFELGLCDWDYLLNEAEARTPPRGAKLLNALLCLDAMRFQGIPTVRQLNAEYERDHLSYALLVKRGLDLVLGEQEFPGTLADSLIQLKTLGALEAEEADQIERLAEIARDVDESRPGVTVSASDAGTWNGILAKLVQATYHV